MVEPPLWKINESQLGWLFRICMEKQKCSKPPSSNGFVLGPPHFGSPDQRQEKFDRLPLNDVATATWRRWKCQCSSCQLWVANDGKCGGRWMVSFMENHYIWNHAVSGCCRGTAKVLPQILDTVYPLRSGLALSSDSCVLAHNPKTSWQRRTRNSYMILANTFPVCALG